MSSLESDAYKIEVQAFIDKKINDWETHCSLILSLWENSACKIKFREENLKEWIELKCLEMVLCKHWSTEGEVRERAVKGRQVTGTQREL